ncbi:MAG: hypothetical protein C0467_08320 [Planctomycetaceae bacterium]|nr:hypothetical protein [Planctomycetaceae bacterium]
MNAALDATLELATESTLELATNAALDTALELATNAALDTALNALDTALNALDTALNATLSLAARDARPADAQLPERAGGEQRSECSRRHIRNEVIPESPLLLGTHDSRHGEDREGAQPKCRIHQPTVQRTEHH